MSLSDYLVAAFGSVILAMGGLIVALIMRATRRINETDTTEQTTAIYTAVNGKSEDKEPNERGLTGMMEEIAGDVSHLKQWTIDHGRTDDERHRDNLKVQKETKTEVAKLATEMHGTKPK